MCQRIVLALFVLLCSAGFGLAAGDDHDGDDISKKVIDLRVEMGLFTLVTFGALLLITGRTVWPEILEGLKKREAGLVGSKNEASKLQAEAAALRAQYQAEMAAAHAQVRDIIEKARQDALKQAEAILAQASATSAAERETAKQEIAAARDLAVADLHRSAIELASLASAKVLRKELSLPQSEQTRLLNEAMVELSHSPNGSTVKV